MVDFIAVTYVIFILTYLLSAVVSGLFLAHALKNCRFYFHSICMPSGQNDWRKLTRVELIHLLFVSIALVFIPLVNTAAVLAALIVYIPSVSERYSQWLKHRPFDQK